MSIQIIRKTAVNSLPFLLWIALISCSANPAVVPAPQAELPNAIQIPDANIGVTEITSAPPVAIKAFVGSGGEFSDEIAIAPNLITEANGVLNGILPPNLSIPVDPNLTSLVTPTEIAGNTVEVAIDFAPFDYDGDQIAENCSGNTQGLPICMRIWTNGSRYLEAVFDDYPTSNNPGAGRYKVLVNDKIATSDVGVRFNVNYDHQDPENIFTDSAILIPPESFALSMRRSVINQEGPVGSAKKTINYSSFTQFGGSSDPSTIQYIGSFRENKNFWSGSLQISDNLVIPGLSDISDVCAYIPNGEGVDSGTCSDLMIDTSNIDFIGFVTESYFEFSDFPLTPTI